ncbi:endo alpha-1,4 polygalactosaminidase [Brachybacterium sp. DNPG3]
MSRLRSVLPGPSLLVVPALLCLIASSCAASPAPALSSLPSGGGFDYQLGGAADPEAVGEDLAVVVRDAGDPPLEGAYSICYVNGFQTQPGEEDLWADAPDAILRDADGEPVIDPDWPDEQILDPATEESRAQILDRIGPVISTCAEDGYDAVEIDNLDTFTRIDGIDEEDALALAGAYVERAHAEGLAIAQKNTPEVSERAREELGFDLAVVEECGAYRECADYTDVYGDAVLQVEYPDSLEEEGISFEEVCADPDRAPLTILRDRDLVPPSEDAHLRRACEDAV